MNSQYSDSEYRRLVRLHGIDDEERRLWVMNDEGLYNWYRSSRLSVSKFIRENRKEITLAILKVLE